MKLHHPAASPNSRRVRIFLAEMGLSIPLVTVDLGKGEQLGWPALLRRRYHCAGDGGFRREGDHFPVPDERRSLKRWYDAISSRSSAAV
jgi:hypothetical protein